MTPRVSTMCETWIEYHAPCGKPAVLGYPAMGGGYHMMCDAHAEKHRDYCVTLEQAQRGEKPDYPKRTAPKESQ